jgi:hypothetical protein
MLREVYERLNPPLQKIVDDVETLTGFEIDVRPAPDHREGDLVAEPGSETTLVAGVVLGLDEIAIEYPTTVAALSFEELAHELLHIRRTYLERSINLFPRDVEQTAEATAAALIDNLLEHQIIYAEQIRLCPGLTRKIDADITGAWNDYPWPTDDWSGRATLLLGYIEAKRYGGVVALAAMTAALAQLSEDERAKLRRTGDRMLSAGDDKRKLIDELFRYSGLPRDRFVLRQFDEPGKPFRWLAL